MSLKNKATFQYKFQYQISKNLRCCTEKPSTCCFYLKTKISADSRISVPL